MAGPGNQTLRSEAALQDVAESHGCPCLCILPCHLVAASHSGAPDPRVDASPCKQSFVGHGPGRLGFLSSPRKMLGLGSKVQTWTECSCSVGCCFGAGQTAVRILSPPGQRQVLELGVWCAEKAIGPHSTGLWKKQGPEGW